MKHLHPKHRREVVERELRLLSFAEGESESQSYETEDREQESIEVKFTDVCKKVGDWWKKLPVEGQSEIKDKLENVIKTFEVYIQKKYGRDVMPEMVFGPRTTTDVSEESSEPITNTDAEEFVEETEQEIREVEQAPHVEPLPENDAARRSFENARDAVVDRNASLTREQFQLHFEFIGRQGIGNCFMMCVLNSLSDAAREQLMRTSVAIKPNGDYEIYLPMGNGRTGTPITVPRSVANSARISDSSPGYNAVMYALGIRYIERVRNSVSFDGNRYSVVQEQNQILINAMDSAGLLGRIGRENPPPQDLVIAVMNRGGSDNYTIEDLIGTSPRSVGRSGQRLSASTDRRRLDTVVDAFARNRNRSVLTLSAQRNDNDSITLTNLNPPPPDYRILVGTGHVIAAVDADSDSLTLVDSNRPNNRMRVARSEVFSEFNSATVHTMDNLRSLPA